MPDFKHDLPASLVVFLIALPLSIGIAQASGLQELDLLGLGLVTAIIGGIVVGVLGGAPLQISGPSAGLAVLVAQMIETHGIAKLGIIVLIAGAVQLVAGLLRFGRQFQAVSPAVIRGMLSGIGVLIIASQFHAMIDDDVSGSGLDKLLAIPAGILKSISMYQDVTHDEAALIGIGTLVVVLGWDKIRPAKLKFVPGPLLALVLAGLSAALLRLPIRVVSVPENMFSLFHFPNAETFNTISNAGEWGTMLTAGLALAFVASAETLLCAGAVARMHDRGRTNYDRELVAHGIANSLCGVVGSLPITGVISRSTANVQANAMTRWSSVFHAIWIALFVVFLPDVLALIPTSALAAILIYIGFKLINVKAVRALSRFGKPVMGIFIATVVGVVAIDLLKGIIIGLVLSAMRLIWQMSHVHFELEDHGDRIELHMHGSATFLGLPKLQDVLDRIRPKAEVHLYFDELEFIDHACLDLFDEFAARYKRGGGTVIVEWDELFHKRTKKSEGAAIRFGQIAEEAATAKAAKAGAAKAKTDESE